jgi:predicted PurR-regulated permease PerM
VYLKRIHPKARHVPPAISDEVARTVDLRSAERGLVLASKEVMEESPEKVVPLPLTPRVPESPPEEVPPVDARGLPLTVVMVLAVVLTLQWARPLLVPILIGVLVSYSLDPVVKRLVVWRVPHPFAATIVFVSTVAGVGLLTYSLSHQVLALTDQLPAAAQQLRETLQSRRAGEPGPVAKVQKAAEELQKLSGSDAPVPDAQRRLATVAIQRKPFDLGDYLWASSLSVTTFAGDTVVVLFLAFYLLLAGDLFRRRLVEIAGPTLSRKKITLHILDGISVQVSRYLFVRLVISIIVSAGTFLAFWLVGLDQPGVWGVAAGLLNVIPYFGPAVIAGAAGIAAFLQFHTLVMAALTAGIAVGVASIEAYAVTPWLMSRTAEMNPAAVFLGLIFWGWLWGLPGLFLAVPIMMVIKTISDHVEALQPVATLLKH